MTTVNNNKPVIDTPIFQQMTPPPAAVAAGVCMTGDSVRFLYALFSATSFWRYDCQADAWQQLANPPGGTLGVGTCLQWDSANSRLWALITNGVATPTFQYYDPTTNTWTARSVTNLPATFGTDGNMAMPTMGAGAASSDFIYLVGNNAATFYRYQISTNAWVASPTTVANAPTASGAGCGLVFLPGHGGGNDHIIRVAGGATNRVDQYSISGNAWTQITYKPDTETFTTGSYMCKLLTGAPTQRLAISKDATGRIVELDLSAGSGPVARMLATQYVILNGAAVAGNRMDTIVADGIEYLYLMPNTTTQLVRMGLLY
jgi:hypothetical protein